MVSPFYHKSASFLITLVGVVTNTALAIQVLAASRSIKWEPEFEWDSSNDTYKVDSIKVVWGLLLSYCVSAAAVGAVGLVGVVKSKPSFVRFYRDYSIADFSFCAFVTVASAYGAFQSSTRTGVCEEISRQPELLRNLADFGLSLENCERWFERAVMAFVLCMVVVISVRLRFLISVSRHYSYMTRHSVLPTHARHPSRQDSMQRIFIIPRAHTSSSSSPTVYAPVPLDELTPELRQSAMEAWVKRVDTHHRHKSQPNSARISLPILPQEGLLPHNDEKA